MMTAGVIGLGQMGRGIAGNLARAGLLAAAWDISPEARAAAALPESVALRPPGELAGLADVVFLVVPSSREVESCLVGPDGLLAGTRPGQVLVDLTTSYPADTMRLAASARAAGRDYLDCGMTGGAAGAADGTLTLMIGGEEAAFERCRSLLETIAGRLIRVGGSGAGHTMKLVHNLVCHTNFLALCEGCRLAESAGLDLASVIDVINAGNARSYISEVRFPKHILTGQFDGRSRLTNLAKDLGMACDLALEHGRPAPYGQVSATLLADGVAAGHGEEDFTRFYRIFDEIAGLVAAPASDRRAASPDPEHP